MSKPAAKAADRLQRRQNGFKSDKGSRTMAGSLNRHKASPVANGRRTKSKIQADSRNATT